MRKIDKLNSTKQFVVTSSSGEPNLAIAAAGALFDEDLSKDAKERQFHFNKNLNGRDGGHPVRCRSSWQASYVAYL